MFTLFQAIFLICSITSLSPVQASGADRIHADFCEYNLMGGPFEVLDSGYVSIPWQLGIMKNFGAAKTAMDTIPIDKLQKISIATFNTAMKNRFDDPEKQEWQRKSVSAKILSIMPGIVVTQETPDLREFSFKYLKNIYIAIEAVGNDVNRRIGFLVRRDLPFDIEVQTHRTDLVPGSTYEQHIFTRDLPALIFRQAGDPTSKPLFILLGAHFKRGGGDLSKPMRGSRLIAKAESDRAAEIIAQYKAFYGNNITLILAGDLNGDFNQHPVFTALRTSVEMLNPMQTLAALPLNHRFTHVETDVKKDKHSFKKPITSEFDYILVNSSSFPFFSNPQVLHYYDSIGQLRAIPKRKSEIVDRDSDHLMVTLDYDFQKNIKPSP
jgi:hypothetical protein